MLMPYGDGTSVIVSSDRLEHPGIEPMILYKANGITTTLLYNMLIAVASVHTRSNLFTSKCKGV